MIKEELNKEVEEYSECKLEDSILINGNLIDNIFISHHYKENHGSYMNDEMILELIKKLKNLYFEYNRSKHNWKVFDNLIWYNNKCYKLIWYTEDDDKNSILVLNTFRYKKHEK